MECKMYSDCPEDSCKSKAYMFPFTVVFYSDQTVIAMTLLCPVCYNRHVIEYGLESLEGRIMDKREMSQDEVKLVHELDAS